MTSSVKQNSFEMAHSLGTKTRDDRSKHIQREFGGTTASPLIRVGEGGDPDQAISNSLTTSKRKKLQSISVKWLIGGGILLLLLSLIGAGSLIYFHQNTKPDTNIKTKFYTPTNDTNLSTEQVSGKILPDESMTTVATATSSQTQSAVVAGTPSNKTDPDHEPGWNFFYAIVSHNETEVERLIKAGEDVNACVFGRSPLHLAAFRTDKIFGLKVIKLLIENGGDVYARDEKDCTFLHRLLETPFPPFGVTTTQLHDMAKFLIERNLTQLFNTPTSNTQYFRTRFRYALNMTTPFHLAVTYLELPMATLMLLKDNGVDFNAINSRGDSTLFYALLGKRSLGMITDLVELGADWRHLNNFKENMLHLAALHGGVDELKYFLGLGLDINVVNTLGDTPLHKAVYYSVIDVPGKAKFLIENGANDDIANNDGMIPLDYAVMRDDLVDKDKLVEFLMNSQANE